MANKDPKEILVLLLSNLRNGAERTTKFLEEKGEKMSVSKLVSLATVLCLIIAVSASALAQGTDLKEGTEQAQKASTVLKEFMGVPDKAVPGSVMAKAHCVAAFPNVIKGGFIVGGKGGRGVVSCRTAGGWSAPAYFSMKGGSFGLQIGAQSTDFILIFMNESAMQSLLKSKFTLGGDASVAAGPVGREAGAETDALMKAQVLSYSRSKGVFGGLELKGTTIAPEKGEIEKVYGKSVTAEQVLKMEKDKAPSAVQVYPDTVAGVTSGKTASR